MGMFDKDPEKAAEKQAAKDAKAAEKAREAEASTPVGQAREAWDRGDALFQVHLAGKAGEVAGINESLNAIVAIGWRMVGFGVGYSVRTWTAIPTSKNSVYTAANHATMYDYVFERPQADT